MSVKFGESGDRRLLEVPALGILPVKSIAPMCPITLTSPRRASVHVWNFDAAGVRTASMSTAGEADHNSPAAPTAASNLRYICYGSEKESPYLPAIRQLISKDLSEPYSIYVYRYFLYQWGDLCFMAVDDVDNVVGVIVCKLEPHRGGPIRGYIAMLATRQEYRGQGIASKLVRMALEAMISKDADEIALETEIDNTPSLRIYENLGFLRTKRLHRYYLNGNTAFRLVLYLKAGVPRLPTYAPRIPENLDGPNADDLAGPTAPTGVQDVVGERFDVLGRSG